MKAVIIEDEFLNIRSLQKMLLEIAPDIEIVAKLHSLKESVEWLEKNAEPDLLFLDIQLSDGVSFDIFNEVKIDCPVIFTTAYNEYAIRAFKVNSIDYLLKPIDKEELRLAIEKWRKFRAIPASTDLSLHFSTLLKDFSQITEKQRFKERFMVHSGKSMIPVKAIEIACFVKDTLIYLVTHSNEKHITDYQTLEELENLLNPADFFRANRQYIIHLQSVHSFKSSFNGKITLRLKPPVNVEIDISREKAQQFKEWLG